MEQGQWSQSGLFPGVTMRWLYCVFWMFYVGKGFFWVGERAKGWVAEGLGG